MCKRDSETVTQWHCGREAQWNSDSVALWKRGTVEQWHCGRETQWNSDSVALWKRDTVEQWLSGTEEERHSQERITRSPQLPHIPAMVFSQADLFLV